MNMPVLFVEFIHLFFLQSIFLCASHRTWALFYINGSEEFVHCKPQGNVLLLVI